MLLKKKVVVEIRVGLLGVGTSTSGRVGYGRLGWVF